MLLALMFVILPPSPKSSRRSLPWYDLIFSLLSLFTGFYIFICYPDLISTIGVITPFRVFIGTIVISLVIEGTRRTSGWILVAVVLFFIVYFKFGYLFSGILEIQKISWERMVTQLFLGADSIYGVALRTAAIIVFGFILFAQVMFGTGGAKFLFGLAEAAMGRYRGGPAKAGVLASAFFGMLSGSAVANVAATGTLTIPMMKDIGYKPHLLQGISSCLNGGVITPNYGRAAFIISEFLGVPYAKVLLSPSSLQRYIISAFYAG